MQIEFTLDKGTTDGITVTVVRQFQEKHKIWGQTVQAKTKAVTLNAKAKSRTLEAKATKIWPRGQSVASRTPYLVTFQFTTMNVLTVTMAITLSLYELMEITHHTTDY